MKTSSEERVARQPSQTEIIAKSMAANRRREIIIKKLKANLQTSAIGIEYARKMNYSGVDIEEAHNRLDNLADSVAHLHAAITFLAELEVTTL